MEIDRVGGGSLLPPFPVYENLVEDLLAAHEASPTERDPTVAHVLGCCAGYAYSDARTVAMMMTRLGLEANACVRIEQTVGAMFIYSTAFLVQSRCGRVVILCYRGTEPATLGNWIADTDVGSESFGLTTDEANVLRVHAGFHRNVRASRWTVVNELQLALQGRSLLDPDTPVEHPLEALYLAGHSLGGAMASLFALTLARTGPEREIVERLRAIYTFGQPMVVGEPLPAAAKEVGRRLFRHVIARDLVPALPPAAWGQFAHFGNEYRHANGRWERAATPVAQLTSMKEIPRSLLAIFANEKRRAGYRYTLDEHGPHRYISALRPKGRVTEFGDQAPTEA
jgi:pimeloyl-ACP methyl ester carboxylesterase